MRLKTGTFQGKTEPALADILFARFFLIMQARALDGRFYAERTVLKKCMNRNGGYENDQRRY